jgi:hypothetical protein
MSRFKGKLLSLVCLAALAAAVLAWTGSPDAQAGREDPCYDSWISETVQAATGNVAVDYVCNPVLYGGGHWDSKPELQGYVNGVMNTCGADQDHRNLTQAVIEVTGIVPSGSTCSKAIYEASYDDRCSSGCGGIAWTHYKDGAGYLETPVWNAVQATLQTCANPVLTQGLIEETNGLPDTRMAYYSYWHSGGSQAAGQCSGTLYGHYGWYSYDNLLDLIDARIDAPTCSHSQVDAAFTALTGWHPLPYECDPGRYVAGNWVDTEALRKAVVGSFRCNDPWIGAIYELDFGRSARGRNLSGECNPILYGNGSWTGSSLQNQYQNLENLMGATQSSLGSVNWSFVGSSGDMEVERPASEGGGTVRVDAGDIRFANLDGGQISTSSGNVIASGGGNVIASGGANVIAPGGGNIAVNGGAAIISAGGGSVIAAGGGNVIASGGANLISDKGLGVIASGGANVIASGGGN